MEKLIVLNHKMNLLPSDIYDYLNKLNNLTTDCNLIVCPSSIYLETFLTNTKWAIGSQTVCPELETNYTGEISTDQLKDLGLEYCIVGHYEERTYKKETTNDVRKKVEACLEANIIPIVCFGEDNPDDAYRVIEEQLDIILKNINHIEFIIFAYEPNWLIDTDNYYDEEELQNLINYIYEILNDKYQVEPTIIYGGNVNKNNINSLLNLAKIKGVMIGKDSADIEKLAEIITSIN